MNSRKIFAGLASVAMAASMVGCSSSSSSSSDSTDSTSTSSDKALIVGTTQELQGVFSPIYYTTAYDAWVVNLVYESMLKYNADSELETQIAAEMPTLAEDGNSVTFKLKEGLTFSDGSALDANDVKFTFTLMADPEYIGGRLDGTYNFIEGWEEYQKGDAEEVSGIVVEDDYTVTFKFGTKDIDAVNSIATMKIMSDTQFEYSKGDMGGYKSSNTETLGSNAYKVNSYDKSTGASLVLNENFKNDGDYKIEKVLIKTIGTATELASLENGDINYFPESIEADIIGPASLNENLSYNYYFRSAEGYMGFNCADGPTADPAVRQALAYATDRASFVEAFYKFPESSESIADVGLGYVPTAFWSPVATGMGEYTTGEESLEGLVEYDFDVEKAKQVLEDAGWTVGSDGIREKDGQKLEIKFLASEGNSVLEMLIPMITKSWGEIGVDLKQNTVDFNTLVDTVSTDSEDATGWSCYFMATSFTGLSNTSMNDALGFTGTVDDYVLRGDNYARIVDEDLNNYLKAGKETTDEATSIENYKKAMIRESELVPYLPMYGNNLFNIYASNVKNVNTGPVCNWSQALNGAYIE